MCGGGPSSRHRRFLNQRNFDTRMGIDYGFAKCRPLCFDSAELVYLWRR
ncbi:hypothetical protein CGRA01v4_03279 [Colletotrichum graminicola]|nr:hypothetical protein CGRA01v4_03279 [Colletotrichum graminicola]